MKDNKRKLKVKSNEWEEDEEENGTKKKVDDHGEVRRKKHARRKNDNCRKVETRGRRPIVGGGRRG